jgi:predicted dehydrogenase
MTEMEYQMLNWYYFNWLCGDHIAEQHVHNLDVANWFLGALPVSAQGMGGREVRTGNKHGEIYDHHYVELTYPNGVIVNSQCRHQPGCFNQIREEIHGTAGILHLRSGSAEIKDLDGKSIWRYRAPKTGAVNPYQAEHDHLHACIRSGEAVNDAHYGATSTMCAVIGRYATYSGKQIKWDEAMEKGADLLPEKWAWDADPKVMPNADGSYPVAVPGVFNPYA